MTAMAKPSTTVGDGRTLSARLSSDLVRRLRDGEWAPGERLPGEHQLAAEYGVSRATVRTALRHLESLGLTSTRHGIGTFATVATREIRADLRHLDSLSHTISSYGMVPGMRYRTRRIRAATPEEQQRLALEEGAQVLATERALTADGAVVAFSYDAIDRRLLSDDLDPGTVEGSLFALLEGHGVRVSSAITELHATTGSEIGWGRRPRGAAYLLLAQVHYADSEQPVMYSRTYFLEGRFTFSLVRTR